MKDSELIEHIRSIVREEINKSIKDNYMASLGAKMVGESSIMDNKEAKEGAKYVRDNIEKYLSKSMPVNHPKLMLEKDLEYLEKAYKSHGKTKKQKQGFDGKYKIIIREDGSNLQMSNLDESILKNTDFHIATQAEINQFFHGTKYRKKKIFHFYKSSYGKYFKREDSCESMTEITKKEYLEGLK